MPRIIGRSIPRVEDPRLLKGRGRFVADLRADGLLEAVIVRSPHAHARIRGVRAEEAQCRPGVAAVVTPDALVHSGAFDRAVRAASRLPILARDTVHYTGEPVAVVVAASRYAAEDAAEDVAVDYEPLPVLADLTAAVAPDAPRVRDDIANNIAIEKVVGYGDIDAAFHEAEIVVEGEFSIARAGAHPLETRGLLAQPDPVSGGVIVWAGTQMPHVLRRTLSLFLELPERAVRVIAPDVGGAFGSKASNYPEDLLIPYLAVQLDRPVRWLEDRREHFVATNQARQQVHRARVAARRDGTLLGLDDVFSMDMGAYAAWPHLLDRTIFTMPGPYHLPAYRNTARGVLTHKPPAGPYRGAGRPQGNYIMERMLDRLADALGVDPAEVRRRNFVQPHELPYTTPLGVTYDSGDYPAALEKALEISGYGRWREEQSRARSNGRYIGIGLSSYIEDTGGTGPYEAATARLEPDGGIAVYSGAPSAGQSHETTFAQVAAERLGLPVERISIIATDTAYTSLGIGTFGSRGAGIAAGAIYDACAQLEARIKELAASVLEAAPDDLELTQGTVRVKGTPDRSVTFEKLGRLANTVRIAPLPPGVTPGAEATAYRRARAQYGNGTHVSLVEVDPDTGLVKLLAYTVVHDCGALLNPTVVTGQVQGGVAQGASTVLFEELRYDEAGQLENGTYLDYLLPTATDLPAIAVEHAEHPSPFTPTGAKGAGEGGTIPALACVANAIEDALRPFDARLRDLPASPDRIWRLLIPSAPAAAASAAGTARPSGRSPRARPPRASGSA